MMVFAQLHGLGLMKYRNKSTRAFIALAVQLAVLMHAKCSTALLRFNDCMPSLLLLWVINTIFCRFDGNGVDFISASPFRHRLIYLRLYRVSNISPLFPSPFNDAQPRSLEPRKKRRGKKTNRLNHLLTTTLGE